MTTLDTFETALLARLREEVTTRSAHRPRWRISAAAAGLVGAGVSAFVWWPQPAWAVDGKANGDVSVTIRSFSDVAGLRAALAAEGVDSVISNVGSSGFEQAARAADAPRSAECDAISRFSASVGGGEATYLIPAAGASSGAVLHIAHGGDIGNGSPDVPHESWLAVWWEGGPCV